MDGESLRRPIPDYRIVGELSRSGISTVYLGDDVRDGHRVAVKVLRRSLAHDERYQRRFLRECRMVRSLDHPHIVPIERIGMAYGRPYAVMPYLGGGDLRSQLDTRGPLPLAQGIRVITQVAAALDHVHRRGLVHRDVKPGNILLATGPDVHCHLSDFGIALWSAAPVPVPSAAAEPSQFVGSFGFSAPEQLAGQPVDHRCDVYSLGCLLYACLTGSTPGPDGGLLLPPGRSGRPPSVAVLRPDVPPGVDRVIGTATATDADRRFQSCGALAAVLTLAAGQ